MDNEVKNICSLEKHKDKASEEVVKEFLEWVEMVKEYGENVLGFAGCVTLKDGSVDCYSKSRFPKERLCLVGGIEALKAKIFIDDFNFEE